MRDGSTPYDPADPYWVFKEAAAFEREFHAKVEMPMLAAMAERVDRMWDEAIERATSTTSGRKLSKSGNFANFD